MKQHEKKIRIAMAMHILICHGFFYRIWNANINNFAILWNITKMMNSCHGKGMFKFWHGILPNFAIFGVINLPCNGNNTKNCQICHRKNVYLNAYSIFCGSTVPSQKNCWFFLSNLPCLCINSCHECEIIQKLWWQKACSNLPWRLTKTCHLLWY